MPKNVSFYSNAVANVFLKNGCIVTLIVEVCHAMFARIFFFNGYSVRTLRLELQCHRLTAGLSGRSSFQLTGHD